MEPMGLLEEVIRFSFRDGVGKPSVSRRAESEAEGDRKKADDEAWIVRQASEAAGHQCS
jgi:hypothetical protein